MRNFVSQKILIALSLVLLAGFSAAQARAKSCGLELNVTESNANGSPIQSASATAINLATKKTARAGSLEGFPVFGDLREGRYKITVRKSGYRTVVKEVDLSCRSADEDQNIVTVDVFLKRGSGRRIDNQPMSRDDAATGVSARTTLAPDQVVRNLYAEHKAGKGPFNQNRSRAVVDKYFTAELADTIWKSLNSDTGLNVDPLYNAQDSEITDFTIGKPDAAGDVRVSFKNFGKNDFVNFELERANAASKVFKIASIGYSDAEDLASILSTPPELYERGKSALSGDYLIGGVACSIEETISGFWARVKCADRADFQVVDTETLTFGIFNPNEKGRTGKLIFTNDKFTDGEHIDRDGRKVKITRVAATPAREQNSATPSAEADQAIKKLGVFTNMRFTTEHQYGYSVELWRAKNRIIGFFSASEGLSGDTPIGILEDARFDSASGRLTFRARLSVAMTADRNNKEIPTRDTFAFAGVLKTQKLIGTLTHTDDSVSPATNSKEKITLAYSESETAGMNAARSYGEWKKEADAILAARGPKW